MKEFLECLLNLKRLGVNSIGLSKDYEVWEGGLLDIINRIRTLCPQQEIHLLGWGRDLKQLKELGKMKSIRGIDSAKPLVYASYKIELDTRNREYPGRPKNFFNLRVIDDTIARANIKYFQKLARGKG